MKKLILLLAVVLHSLATYASPAVVTVVSINIQPGAHQIFANFTLRVTAQDEDIVLKNPSLEDYSIYRSGIKLSEEEVTKMDLHFWGHTTAVNGFVTREDGNHLRLHESGEITFSLTMGPIILGTPEGEEILFSRPIEHANYAISLDRLKFYQPDGTYLNTIEITENKTANLYFPGVKPLGKISSISPLTESESGKVVAARLTLSGARNVGYRLESSYDFIVWNDLGTWIMGEAGSTVFVSTETSPHQFFRLKELQ